MDTVFIVRDTEDDPMSNQGIMGVYRHYDDALRCAGLENEDEENPQYEILEMPLE